MRVVAVPETGAVVLSGDLYHYPEERTIGGLPDFEFDREQSLASRVAVEAVLTETGGQLWIGHDLHEFDRVAERGRSGIW